MDVSNVKMIVTDLDRTLLLPGSFISDYTAKVLKACQQKGIMVVFATARSEERCQRFIEQVKPDAVITNGGAHVRIGDKIIYRAVMSSDVTDGVILNCLKQKNIGYISVYTDEGHFVNKSVSDNEAREKRPFAHAKEFSNGVGLESYKITVEIFDDAIIDVIAEPFSNVEVTRFTGEAWVRFANKAATKWEGVKALASHMGIDLKDVAAFGDDYNDVEMLCGCGVGVAVDNAIDEVKAVADFVCGGHGDDGVARWVEENVLSPSRWA